MTALLDAALEYAGKGQPVIPLKPGAKVPLLRRWPERASTDADTVRAWWARWPAANVGLVTGEGLAVLDIDPRNGGAAPAWAGDTRTAGTPSGGWHHYFGVSIPVPGTTGRIAPGVDVKATGGYVVAPPSLLAHGSYSWLNDEPVRQLTNEEARERLIPAGHNGRAGGAREPFAPIAFCRSRYSADTRRPLPDDETNVVHEHDAGWPPPDILDGTRNDYLASFAGWAYDRGLDPAAVLAELEAEADRLGFTPTRPREVEKIARSVGRYHGYQR